MLAEQVNNERMQRDQKQLQRRWVVEVQAECGVWRDEAVEVASGSQNVRAFVCVVGWYAAGTGPADMSDSRQQTVEPCNIT